MLPTDPQTPDPSRVPTGRKLPARIARSLRKAGPYALFFLFGLLMLWGPFVVHRVTSFVHNAPAGAAPGPLGNATGAEVAAEAQAAGFPSFGLVTGKLITAAGAYVFMGVVLWALQQLTHPTPSRWAKTEYADAFDGLESLDKFAVYQRLRLHLILLGAAALVFAALVQ